MPRKVKQAITDDIKELEEPIESDEDKASEPEPEPEPEIEPVVEEIPKISFDKNGKPKRKLTEKQLEALKRGREKGVEKLKEKGQITKQKKEIQKKIVENEIKDIQELKKVADYASIDKKVEVLHSRFSDIDNKLSTLIELKKKKHSSQYQNALKQQIREEAQNHILKEKTQSYNKWLSL